MRKAILLLVFLAFMGNGLACAEGKIHEFTASCYVPERLELSSATLNTDNLKEGAQTISKNLVTETQFLQKEEIRKSNPDKPATVVYTLTAR